VSKPRLLIIGLGSIGERHLRCAQQTNRVELLACEINNSLRNTVADRYGIGETYADFASALAAKPSAAAICVPAQLHVKLAQQLAESGVHLLIEKPLDVSLAGVDRLQQTVADRNLTAAVAYVHRANPALAAMRQALHSGRFGKPLQLIAVTGQNFPYYRPAYAETYYRDRATGGGAVQDALTHIINAGEWLLGPVERVLADAAHQALPGVEVEDTVHALVRHQGVPGCYSLNQHQAPNELTITVVCQNGTARYEAHENRWRWMTELSSTWHDEPIGPLERDDLFVSQMNAFLDAVDGTGQPLCSLAEGAQTLRVNMALLQSIDKTTWTSVL
jgi:predicted dehydrogenase